MTVKIHLSKQEKKLAEDYAQRTGLSLNEAMKDVFFEKIEDEYDIALADAALREYEKDHISYSHEQVKNMLD